MAEIHVHTAPADAELLEMLREWLQYWDTEDHMPAKMPDALHVRTAMALQRNGYDVISTLGGNPPP